MFLFKYRSRLLIQMCCQKRMVKICRHTGATLNGTTSDSSVSTLCDGTALFLKKLHFMCRLYHGPSPVPHLSSVASGAFLLPFSSAKKFCHSRLRRYFETDGAQGCLGVEFCFIFFYFKADRIVLVCNNFFFIIVINLKPFEIWNFHLNHKL